MLDARLAEWLRGGPWVKTHSGGQAMTMLEELAQIIDPKLWEGRIHLKEREHANQKARAFIQRLKEPSEEMLESVARVNLARLRLWLADGITEDSATNAIREDLCALLDAIIEEHDNA